MDLVTGAVGSLIPKLGELLKAEYDLQKGVPEQIQSLILELECAQAALNKVGQVPPDQLDEQVRIWARHVREASYDMEDILDTFHVRIEGCHDPTDKKSLLKHMREKMTDLFRKSKARHGIAGAIKEIKKRLQEATDRRDRFTIDNIVAKPASPSSIDPRLAAMYKEVTQLVGIDKSRGELKSMLSSKDEHRSDKKLKIVSIVGTGGLGKSTLAKASYEDLKSGYDCNAFITVGRNPNLEKVFRDILIDLDKGTYMDSKFTILDQRQLINELQEFLREKRYFIVIDDIWEIEPWETIKLALIDNNIGSTVITTTRKVDVAIKADEVYKLQPLSDDNAKKLFYTRIFGSEDKCPDSALDEVSDKILKKCGGVPLAVITMASLLVGKSREEWFEVHNTIGFRDKYNKQVDDTKWIVSLSYYDLPPHLKTCLLYLSVFPEDYFIHKDPLIWMWIAEGFIIKQRQEVRLFEVGEEYYHDLVNKSMIMAEESDAGILGCRVHDMVLDVIRSLSSEENFVTISGNYEGTSSKSRSVRRLAHQNRRVELTYQNNHKGMRSLIAVGCNIDKSVSFLSFTVLRVLALEGFSHMEGYLPLNKHLNFLLHLRYFGLRNSSIRELPIEIGDLKFLQVLDFQGTRIAKLPSSVALLSRLVCLCGSLWTVVQDKVIEKLTSLEELTLVRPVDDDNKSKVQFMKELGNLTELRVLNTGIFDSSNKMMVSNFLQSVGNLQKLQHLQLLGLDLGAEKNKAAWDAAVLPASLRHLIMQELNFSRLPSCMMDASRLPSRLSRLELFVSTMDEQGLKILGGMPELRHLYLNTYSTVTLTNVLGCFNKLTSCAFPSSVVQLFAVLNHNQEDSDSNSLNSSDDVSLTLWSKDDDVNNLVGSIAIAIARKKKAPPLIVMPNLQRLRFNIDMSKLITNGSSYCDCDNNNLNLGLEYLPSLHKVMVRLHCYGALPDEVKKVEAALKRAVQRHPNLNQPTLQIDFFVGWRPGKEIEDKISSFLRRHKDKEAAAVNVPSPSQEAAIPVPLTF